MNFIIEKKEFNSNIDLLEKKTTIKSYNKNYNVIYSQNKLSELIKEYYNQNDFIIIDKNVFNLDILSLSSIDSKYYHIFEALEINKNMDYVLKIIDILLELNFNKKNKLIVIGGGITQDVAGFVSAMFKRGINWIYIPTTLLSITDSAIGAKVNVNRKSKNMLGLFYAPNIVCISDYFLDSLSNDDIVSGLGESLKLCLIGGNECLKIFIDNYKIKNYNNIIRISTLVKKLVIEYDELEKNERKALNYGHECAHALESTSNYYIPHGIAVLFGMYIVNTLFYDNKYNSVNDLILEMIPDKYKKLNLSYDEFIKHLLNDKKNDGDNICFIILEEIGNIQFKFKKLNEINVKLKNIFDIYFNK
jgi:3-dehydroquinate synthase